MKCFIHARYAVIAVLVNLCKFLLLEFKYSVLPIYIYIYTQIFEFKILEKKAKSSVYVIFGRKMCRVIWLQFAQ